jgi:hypothetical protein
MTPNPQQAALLAHLMATLQGGTAAASLDPYNRRTSRDTRFRLEGILGDWTDGSYRDRQRDREL